MGYIAPPMPAVPTPPVFRTPPGWEGDFARLAVFWKENLRRKSTDEIQIMRRFYSPNEKPIQFDLIRQEWDRRTLLRPALPAACVTKSNELLRAISEG